MIGLLVGSALGHSQARTSSALVRVQAVPALTVADPVPGGGTRGEVRLLQPVAMLDAAVWRGRVRINAALNGEGWSIADGELSPGAWGEGFMDRRHPHTYVHELMVSTDDVLGRFDGPARVSLALGKGFVPFGTDDPMSRPPLRFPVNHHLSQILERAVGIVGWRWTGVAIEAALFNGDEPERPGQWPQIGGRFGDSRSLRLTLFPVDGIEIQASHAEVHSPEHRPGAGLDAFKWSASARWERPVAGRPAYVLLEWARTSEADGLFVFHTTLAEAAYRVARLDLYYRFERTERPEEERTLDPFRSQRPHIDDNILGITRWSIHTLGFTTHLFAHGSVQVRPFMEASLGSVDVVGQGVFDPQVFYGGRSPATLSIGARIVWSTGGWHAHRMGRYGVVASRSPHATPPATGTRSE